MRKSVLALLPLLASSAFAPAASACDAKADVEAAFTIQHKNPWRTSTAFKSSTGVEQTQTIDFQPPDRLSRKLVAGDESIETIGIGKSGWSNDKGGWTEMRREMADLMSQNIKSAFEPPKVSVEFTCLGTVKYEGKDYLGYQTVPETVDGKLVARTIYVDPETKLPAFNVVGAPDGSGEPIAKDAYSYPTDIKIESPL
jgi:hypothetical protein